jgi:hypothetical protein
VIAFREPFERRQLRDRVVVAEHATCLALKANDVLAMLSDVPEFNAGSKRKATPSTCCTTDLTPRARLSASTTTRRYWT